MAQEHSEHHHEARNPTDELKKQGQGLADEAREHAYGLAEEARDRAYRAAEARKSAAAEYIEAFADAFRAGARELDGEGFGTSASFVNRAADEVEVLSDRLRDQDGRRLIEEVQDFARERPALFIGAAFLAGIAGTRFLRSSQHHDHGHPGGRRSAGRQEPQSRPGPTGAGPNAPGRTETLRRH